MILDTASKKAWTTWGFMCFTILELVLLRILPAELEGGPGSLLSQAKTFFLPDFSPSFHIT
jgi:hypothetical protein